MKIQNIITEAAKPKPKAKPRAIKKRAPKV